MYYRTEFDIYKFPFWSGAYSRMQDATSDQIEQVKERIEEYFGYDEEAPTDTEINDLVWFECDDIFFPEESEEDEEDEDLEEGCGKPSKEVKESDEDDAEWKVVRQNAKANPSLYGGRYADKDSRKAKKEWLKDRKEQSLNEEDEEIEIDLEDWGLGDLKEDDEKRPSNRFKSDPKLYSHKKLEDLRAKHSDDDIDKVYKLSGEEVRSHNKWLKRKGKDNLMQEANGFKKVVDKHLNKKPVEVKALRESLEEFSSDFPEFEEFSAEETFENPEDCICMNVPLTMRVLEYTKESNLTDEDLHNIVEKATSMCADGKCLSMDDYDSLIEKGSEKGSEE